MFHIFGKHITLTTGFGMACVAGLLFGWGMTAIHNSGDAAYGYGSSLRINPETGRPYGEAVPAPRFQSRKADAKGRNLEPTKTLKQDIRAITEAEKHIVSRVETPPALPDETPFPTIDVDSTSNAVTGLQPVSENKPELKSELKPEPKPETKPELTPQPVTQPATQPVAQPAPKPEPKPEIKPEPKSGNATLPTLAPATELKERPKTNSARPQAVPASPSVQNPLPTIAPVQTPVQEGIREGSKEDFLTQIPKGISGPSAPATTGSQPAPQVPDPANRFSETAGLVNYGGTPDGIKVEPNDILINDAIVEIPKGEGYEALISANGQGLLVELGTEELDANGQPVLDANGQVQRKAFHRGDRVKKGQILGKQNDRENAANKLVAEQQLLVARKEAEKQLEVEVAKLAVQVAESEYLRAKSANEQIANAVSAQEIVQKAYEWKRADKSAEKAVYDLDIKSDEVKVREAQVVAADAQVMDRKLVSPIDGFIDDIMQNEGQWLREGDNILKIIRLDRVTICGKIDATLYSPEMVDGKEVTIYVQKPGLPLQTVKGHISYARQVVESARFYIYAEADNVANEGGYWLLNPGTIVTMVIHR